MHELSIAVSIMESVLEFTETNGIRNVLSVQLGVGELACVQPDQLKFCYSALAVQTRLEDSSLEIETIPALVKCPCCRYAGSPKYLLDGPAAIPIPTLQCPSCGATVEAVRGHECVIKKIRHADKLECANEA